MHACQPSDISVLKLDLEHTLKVAHDWFVANSLKLNPKKTDILLTKARQRKTPSFSIDFNGITLVPSAKIKILGVMIDAHLTWEAHVSQVVRRCYATLRGLSKFAHCLSYDVKKFLIEALVMPHIRYCITVWGGCGITQQKRVQKILNHCARVVFSVRKSEHVSPLLRELQWSSISTRVCERDLLMLRHLLSHPYSPQCLSSKVRYRSSVSVRDTRAAVAGHLELPRVRTEMAKRFFDYRALSLWNEALANLKDTSSAAGFKREVEAWLEARDHARHSK